MAKRIRIQNDILIKWRIYRYGTEEILTDKKVTLKLFHQSGIPAPITYYFVGNTAVISFEGRNQSKLGDYTLFLSENAGEVGMTTIDKCNAFSLVRHSEQEGGSCCSDMVTVETVELSSDIDVPCVCFPFEIDENGVLTVLSTGKKFKLTPYVEGEQGGNNDDPSGGNGGNDDPSGGNGGNDNPSGGNDNDNPSGGNGDNPSGDNGGSDNPSGGDTPSGGDDVDEPVEEPKKYVYVGQLNTSKSIFSALADNDIMGVMQKRDASQLQSSFTATQSCFVILVPSGVNANVKFTSGGMTTNISAENLWNLTHSDIVVDGVVYKVYGYRLSTVTENSPQKYDITLKTV